MHKVSFFTLLCWSCIIFLFRFEYYVYKQPVGIKPLYDTTKCERSLQWCHVVSYHRPNDCLFNGLFRLASNKYQRFALLALCEGNPPVTVDSHHKWTSNAPSVSLSWFLHDLHNSWDVTVVLSLRWLHNGRENVSNHQPHHCILNRFFRDRSKKTSKPRVTGLCEGNSPGTGEFPAQMASNAENVSIWWRHHGATESILNIWSLIVVIYWYKR